MDDDPAVADGLALGLERRDRTIIVCYDAASAELVVETTPVTALICDVRLTGPFRFEGLDFLGHVARHAPGAPVTLISGHITPDLQREASRRGAAAILEKPVELEQLEAVLNPTGLPLASGESVTIRVPPIEEILGGRLLTPVFQPIVHLHGDRHVYGFESLARLKTDALLKNPELLFQYAVRCDRLVDLELACIAHTFQEGAALTAHGSLFLNVHPSVLKKGHAVVQTILRESSRWEIPLGRIVIELTEQDSLKGSAEAFQWIDRLRAHGVRFALDDVGMAYSHLPFIEQIRPSFMKVSQHFGSAFEKDEARSKVVRNLLSLSVDFDCDLILEGIESEETAAAARTLNIPFGQGYHYARPAPAIAWTSEKLLTAEGWR